MSAGFVIFSDENLGFSIFFVKLLLELGWLMWMDSTRHVAPVVSMARVCNPISASLFRHVLTRSFFIF